jgi:glycosyltransferase involved in cell wall biosynthesis
VLIAHDESTAARIREELRREAWIVPHGPYVDVYPEGRDRATVRAGLGIADDAFVFLSFGHLRGYKNADVLLDAFARCRSEGAVLVVAGLPLDEEAQSAVTAAAAADPRIRPLLRFVPDDQVAELHGAADAAVLARGDGGTSGALVLALSLGLPVVAAAVPAYEDLTHAGALGWHFAADDADALRRVLEEVAADPATARAKADYAREAGGAGWQEVAATTAALMRAALA